MSSNAASDVARVTTVTLRKMKQAGEKIACLTCYDASFAAILDECSVDIVLVGDSLGMVIQGHETTVSVSMDDMVYHCKAVARGLHRPLLMLDMPFASYPAPEQAYANAARLMQAGAQMVKLEGGAEQVAVVRYLSERGIPVCAHLGLTPQSVNKLGGYRVQGRDDESAQRMREDATALTRAGADVLLLECVPAELAAAITASVNIPVIGIGAGADCDAQVLVLYDILGVSLGKRPRFSKNYLKGSGSVAEAITEYVKTVKSGSFPQPEQSFQ